MALLTGSGAPNILRFLAIIFLKNNSHSVLSSAPIWKLTLSFIKTVSFSKVSKLVAVAGGIIT